MPTLNYSLSLYGCVTPVSRTGGVSSAEKCDFDYALATASTNTAITLGSITTATWLYVYSDQAISVNINSNTETAKSVLANKPLFISGTSITALYVTNASGSTANMKIKAGGA